MSLASGERAYSQVSPLVSRVIAACAHDHSPLPTLNFGGVKGLSWAESDSARAAEGSFTILDDGEALPLCSP